MKSERPLAVSIVCTAGFIGCFLTLLVLISPPIQQVGRWYALYLSAGAVFTVICLGSLWMMRKWAVIGYTLYAILNQGVYALAGMWNEKVLLLQAAIVVVGIYYYKKME